MKDITLLFHWLADDVMHDSQGHKIYDDQWKQISENIILLAADTNKALAVLFQSQ